ncbi:hypothetical protein CVT24_008207 [Panaeolus cyanescens]|uniref:Uncharacterized protein n=1 Tax=Panaeolus cyanescens TaxID=181874 RepID=A0A409VF15_9AGAR|nr:hypothetical protein CVT24_008207 [Panaeolus cyanescens]
MSLPTHTHHTEYVPRLVRSPSPTSSVGTSYPEDQTAFSDTDEQISQFAFERKQEERIRLFQPRKEEQDANRDPLLIAPDPTTGKPIRLHDLKLGEREQKDLYESILRNLRAAVNRVKEDELFDQILLRHSTAVLEPQPSTHDLDSLMKSMMGPALSLDPIDSTKATSRSSLPELSNGPWNNFGVPASFERRESTLPEMTSGTTVGKRSRKGTQRKM